MLLPVKLLLRPSFSHTPVGLGDIKETPFCNVTEDVSLSEPKKGLNSLHFRLFAAGCEPFRGAFLMIPIVHCYGVERIPACAAS